ncbi:hypothetical protein F4774DRAFT_375867 [Daldinia eschscholtzii]|nr:hypothetical protein F4774DRAFT_375867 [Daldinia eschscholtzii]
MQGSRNIGREQAPHVGFATRGASFFLYYLQSTAIATAVLEHVPTQAKHHDILLITDYGSITTTLVNYAHAKIGYQPVAMYVDVVDTLVYWCI